MRSLAGGGRGHDRSGNRKKVSQPYTHDDDHAASWRTSQRRSGGCVRRDMLVKGTCVQRLGGAGAKGERAHGWWARRRSRVGRGGHSSSSGWRRLERGLFRIRMSVVVSGRVGRGNRQGCGDFPVPSPVRECPHWLDFFFRCRDWSGRGKKARQQGVGRDWTGQ